MNLEKKKAVILLSGGIDSATALAFAICDGYEPWIMTFNYGQRHSLELIAAERIAESINVEHRIVIEIDLRCFGGSALTDDIEIPRDRSPEIMSRNIPVTYVPARNTIFLSYALAWAEVLGAHDIYIGVNAIDYSGYPDCRPEYIKAFERLANLATKEGVEGRPITIHAPLLFMSKAEIIRSGTSLGIDYSLTYSCYDPSPDGISCGRCDSCLMRKKGFEEAGVPDPTRYQPID